MRAYETTHLLKYSIMFSMHEIQHWAMHAIMATAPRHRKKLKQSSAVTARRSSGGPTILAIGVGSGDLTQKAQQLKNGDDEGAERNRS